MHHCHYGSRCKEAIQGEKIYEKVKDYKNRSLLIAEEEMKEKLEKILTEGTRAKGGQMPRIKRFKIEKKFENSGFYMIPYTWIVHHDDEFETI